jgi:hypothetical protein
MPHQFPPIVDPPLTCEFHAYKKYFTQRILKQAAGRQNNYLRMLKRAVGFTTLRHHSLDDLRAQQHPAGCRRRISAMQQALHRSSLVPRGFVVESAYYDGEKAIVVVRASGSVNHQQLVMPPAMTLEMAKGFTLFRAIAESW